MFAAAGSCAVAQQHTSHRNPLLSKTGGADATCMATAKSTGAWPVKNMGAIETCIGNVHAYVPRNPLDEYGFKWLKAAPPHSDNCKRRAPKLPRMNHWWRDGHDPAVGLNINCICLWFGRAFRIFGNLGETYICRMAKHLGL